VTKGIFPRKGAFCFCPRDRNTADKYDPDGPGALARNAHDAGNSLGTKNEARLPIVTEYASTSGIHKTAVRGCANDRNL
jgi:hypothetical protein